MRLFSVMLALVASSISVGATLQPKNKPAPAWKAQDPPADSLVEWNQLVLNQIQTITTPGTINSNVGTI